MFKRILLTLALAASVGTAVAACNTPAGSISPSLAVPSVPAASAPAASPSATDLASPSATDLMSAQPSAS